MDFGLVLLSFFSFFFFSHSPTPIFVFTDSSHALCCVFVLPSVLLPQPGSSARRGAPSLGREASSARALLASVTAGVARAARAAPSPGARRPPPRRPRHPTPERARHPRPPHPQQPPTNPQHNGLIGWLPSRATTDGKVTQIP